MAGDDVTLGEVVRRIDDLRRDVRDMRDGAVSTKTFEEWRREAYAPRMQGIEFDIKELRRDFDDKKAEDDRRFRTTVNLFIGGGISVFGGVVLLVLQLVAK